MEWYIILVDIRFYEDGGKIPLKSISMKLLVLAYYAQFWVGAGNERTYGLYIMAYINVPFVHGDLDL